MLILASSSPRRRDLLTQAGYSFTVFPAQVDETMPHPMPPEEFVQFLAQKKAQWVAQRFPGDTIGDTILGADTVVALDGEIFGKPKDAAEAAQMLRRFSGREHTVYTGCCICRDPAIETLVEETRITFFPLTEEDIAWYVSTGEPLDKAGAYGIQGKGALLVEKMQGDFYNVVGLPLAKVHRILQKNHISPKKNFS